MVTKKATKKGTLKVTLRRSTNGRLAAHKACVAGLGLRRIGHTVVLTDTPAIRGIIRRIGYLLSVDEQHAS